MKRQLLKERNPFFVSAGPDKLCVCLWCAYFVRSLCARFAWQQQQHLHIYYLFMCGCVCVCVCFCVSAFMPCINVTMHHLCHLLSAHKCKIWVLLTQRLCPNRRAPPPSPESHALWPSNFVALSVYLLSLPTAHTHRNYLTLASTEIESHNPSCGCLCLGQLFLCCQCWLMNFYSRPADVILIHLLAGQKRP